MLVTTHFQSALTGFLIQLCLISFLCAPAHSDESAKKRIVTTQYGDIRGVRTDKAQQFLGIPYAAPPISSLRWQAPVGPAAWAPDTLDARQIQPGCPQKYCTDYISEAACPKITSESCLYMNIWTPLDASPSSSYPVMFHIHGGAFKWGTGSAPIYDGNNLVKAGNVIMVSIEYRLGILGFLYTGDGPSDAHGNFGILDQRMAMQWVQENIQNFGGDPNKVTLFGQSAGAQSVFVHMMSPKSEKLFRAAIVESAPFSVPYRNKHEARILSKQVFRYIGCPYRDVDCLRGKTVDEINEVQNQLKVTAVKVDELFEPLGPVVDGEDVPFEPVDAARLGKVHKKPLIIGSVSEEIRSFVYAFYKQELTKPIYKIIQTLTHPRRHKKVLKKYPPIRDSDQRDNLCQSTTDYYFTCPIRNAAQNLVKHGNSKTYLYVFDQPAASINNNFTYCVGHVCHGEELAYVFRNGEEANTDLSDTISTYWTNFAHTMNPNKGSAVAPGWPKFQKSQYLATIMHFKTNINRIVTYRPGFCDFWDKIGYDT